jgi:hypothetical protein
MGPPTVLPQDDPRTRQLLRGCLFFCSGFALAEWGVATWMPGLIPWPDLRQAMEARQALFALGGKGGPGVAAATSVLLHAGTAAFMTAALQRTWLRNRSLALSVVLLLFTAFQGALVGLALSLEQS